MQIRKLVRRFLLPGAAVSAYYALKFGCLISPKAEVEVSPQLRIGRNTEVGSFTKVKVDGPLAIGNRSFIGPNCFISSHSGGVTIGDFAMVGAGSSIVGSDYRYDNVDVPIFEQGLISKGITIGENVWLGVGVVVVDGTSIGAGSIVTPNSVVSGNIPPRSIAQGNPAKVIFTRR